MKKIRLLLILLLSFFLVNLNCYALETYTRTEDNLLVPSDVIVDENNLDAIMRTPAINSLDKIYDFADVLSEEEEKNLYASITEYVNNTSIDASIVITKDLGGFTISEYAYNFYDYNDFMHDGVIFVIYLGYSEPQIFMANSGNEQGKVFTIYTDSRINQTLKYVYQDIKVNNYYTACDNYIKIIKGFYNLTNGTGNGNYKVNEDGTIVKEIPWVGLIILSLAITFIVEIILIYKLRSKMKKTNKDVYDEKLDMSTLIVKFNYNNLVDTKLSKKK